MPRINPPAQGRRPWARIIGLLLSPAIALSAGLSVLAAPAASAATPATIPLTITNSSDRSGPVYIYNLGTDLASGKMGWADANGTFRAWPNAGTTPQPAPDTSIAGPQPGGSMTIRVPKFSGRIYFSYGQKLNFQVVLDGKLVQSAVQNDSDPNRNVMFNWSEYTYNDAGIWLNSTQVDMFSAPYQVGVRGGNGQLVSTGRLVPDGYRAVLDGLRSAGWGNTIQTAPDGSVLRAVAPAHAISTGRLDSNALSDYINRVWQKYSSSTLTVVPYGDQPNRKFFGTVQNGRMVFRDGQNREIVSYNKPSSSSVFACDGDLPAPNDDRGAISRTLCAGLNRSTLLTSQTHPSTDPAGFYNDPVTNRYAKLIHQNMVDGKAYAFAFDDVAAQESLVHDSAPQAAYLVLDPFKGAAPPLGGTDNGTSLRQGKGPARIGSGAQCLDVPWGSNADGTQVQIANCNNQAAQQWTRTAAGQMQALGKCLDVRASGTANATPVQLYSCNGTAAQTQSYDRQSGALRNPQSGRYLDAAGGVPLRDGQQLQLWDCNGTAGQRWTF
ncbi:beta-1,3-glucanase family protein [Acaricomes phytoseiuli]|uniref:beta-1,3-glucanase family protein n=1 Tax=Acaricomes phytoseiuli TaxID=291968 RepID=UPI00047771C0|nr:beta-1,3-glucanase family protein [Acaricomes phytoseiuli]